MKEHPILFSTPMVQAILNGNKTMTRRVIGQKLVDDYFEYDEYCNCVMPTDCPCYRWYESEYFLENSKWKPGDRLWVRETWAKDDKYYYKADGGVGDRCGKWKPSIHMPRVASRILLEVVSVRVERVQDITEEDARGEGIADGGCLNCGESEPCGCANPEPDARDSFAYLWNTINEKRGYGWDTNPWVWVVEFKVVS